MLGIGKIFFYIFIKPLFDGLNHLYFYYSHFQMNYMDEQNIPFYLTGGQ